MNIVSTFLALLIPAQVSAAEPLDDMLRFKNGDTLHGQYLGLDEGPLLKWASDEAEDPISFETRNLRKLSLNGGRALKQVTNLGIVTLTNGDILPGQVISMGTDSVTVQTQYGGLLTIPREHVESLQPNRLGGGVLYAGPFNEDQWQVLQPRSQSNQEEEEEREVEVAEDGENDEDLVAAEDSAAWVFGGAAWYSRNSYPLTLDIPLPDRVSIRFHMAWQNRLNVDFALMADFKIPKDEKEAEEGDAEEAKDEDAVPEEADAEPENARKPFLKRAEPRARIRRVGEIDQIGGDIREIGVGASDSERYGTSYLLSLQSTYARLQKLSFDDNHRPRKSSFRTANGNTQLREIYEADFEIRMDRNTGNIALLVNGVFYAEWQDTELDLDDAPRFFALEAQAQSLIRVSDFAIAEWNGMPDSARSMQSEDRDVLLLTNGTDRFSGEILAMEEDVFQVKSDYATFQIPLSEISDIQLARDSRAEPSQPEDGQVAISLQPHGRLTLTPHEGVSGHLRGGHPVLGDVDLDLAFSYLIEFDPDSTIFDNWDDDF